jgi:hypothetical protein
MKLLITALAGAFLTEQYTDYLNRNGEIHINQDTILKTNSGGIEPCLVDYDGDVREVQCTTKCDLAAGCYHAVPHEATEGCRTTGFGWKCAC